MHLLYAKKASIVPVITLIDEAHSLKIENITDFEGIDDKMKYFKDFELQ